MNHPTKTAWRKSTFCNGADACVEVATLPDGTVTLRDGKDPAGLTLTFTPVEWAVFVAGVLAGEFDLDALIAQRAGDGSGVDARSEGASAAVAGSGGGSVPA